MLCPRIFPVVDFGGSVFPCFKCPIKFYAVGFLLCVFFIEFLFLFRLDNHGVYM